MKLSEVTRAHDLVRDRRDLVKAFVSIGRAADIGTSSPYHRHLTLFGYLVDEQMAGAVRRDMRAEIRARIASLDENLASLGVEVEGIEITIAAEEAMEAPKAGEEAA